MIPVVSSMLASCAPEAPEAPGRAPAEAAPVAPVDADADGFDADDDCDDRDASVNPAASEVPYDGVDQDCDGADADDLDGDGHGAATDCDDDDPARSPEADERCDGVDQDCDGEVDEDAVDATSFHADADGDGHGGADVVSACDGVISDDDCDDLDAAVHPDATEACGNLLDDNCDGWIDEMVAGSTHATIQGAIDAACADGDTVRVVAGTYMENLRVRRPLVVVAVDGPATTVVDGGGLGPTVSVESDDVEIHALGITGGVGENGGGVRAEYVGGVVIEGCAVADNQVSGRGGGVYLYGAGSILQNEITGNTAANGGGVYVVHLSDAGPALAVDANLVQANSASGGGGGAYEDAYEGQATWTRNRLTDNTALFGGGIAAETTLVTTDNIVQYNLATGSGGGVWYAEGWWSSGDLVTGNTPDDVGWAR